MLKYFLVSILIFSSYANKKQAINKVLRSSPGCPENSSCSAKMGLKYRDFSNLINSQSTAKLNAYIEKHGIPIRSWTLDDKSTDVIGFDSKCFHHRRAENKISEAISFLKSKSDNLLYREIMSLNKTFIIQLGSSPEYIKNDSITYLDEFDDKLFYVEMKKNFKSRVFFKDNQNYEAPINVKCEPNLVKEWQMKAAKTTNLYRNYYCKGIWNVETQSFETFIFGYTC